MDRSLTLNLRGGENEVDLGTPGQTLNVGQDLTIAAGGGDDFVELVGVKVLRNTRVTLGAGQDELFLTDGSTFTGATLFDLGAGDDLLDMATVTGAAAGVTFSGRATFNLGTDNDTARVGRSAAAGGNAVTEVSFALAGNVLNLGTGVNTFVLADAEVAGPPLAALKVIDNNVVLAVLP